MEIRTNKNHRVHVIEGDASGIIARGQLIEDLGEQMIGAAGVLREIGDGATEEKGRSIEKIRDEVGDTHKELKLAGERYKPTGTAMKEYGSTLSTVQAALRSLVTEIENAKTQLDSKVETAQTAQQAADASADYDADDTAARGAHQADAWQARDAGIAADNARIHLNGLLDDFDTQWDTWDEAYDLALGRINSATHGNITDDWTDNLAGVAEVVVDVLSVVGFVVAIAAIVIGGPILMIVGAVIGAIALIATAFLYFKGRAGLDDLIWAVVGVLPFGKLGKLFKAGERMQALQIFKGPFADIAEGIGSLRSVRGAVSGIASGTGNGLGSVARSGLASRIADTFSGIRWGDIASRSTAINNLTRGGMGSWAANTLSDLGQFTSHHQNVVRTVAGDMLDNLSSVGNITLAERIVNVGDVSVRTYGSGDDAFGVVTELFSGSDENVDSWRAQLAG
ncbi:hypothetical protein JNB62_12075 [Microbacterium jejuense]|uniref:Uncharacterized protein n=1 Tax=Microbacterium jejuense TaxID=1263637 RepID=A0ABS7HQB9_9MICO|nr:hypothetical protein [Microbacterium jejuense]MBW9094422.1 hypothetical protein [Microbacterium jejuense]